MITELFVLCDAATDYQGKLNVLGAFDTVWSRTKPAVYPLCAVALRLRFARTEEGKHTVRIHIFSQGGKDVVKPFEASMNVQFNEEMPQTLAANLILNMQGLTFDDYGEYTIDLSIDGNHASSLPLYIKKFPDKE